MGNFGLFYLFLSIFITTGSFAEMQPSKKAAKSHLAAVLKKCRKKIESYARESAKKGDSYDDHLGVSNPEIQEIELKDPDAFWVYIKDYALVEVKVSENKCAKLYSEILRND